MLRLERQGIDERLKNATDGSAQRILERVAKKRREHLDNLPAEPGGAIRELQGYEFMDQRAEQAFQKLLEEIKQNVVNTYFKQMSEQMGQMSQQDVSASARWPATSTHWCARSSRVCPRRSCSTTTRTS